MKPIVESMCAFIDDCLSGGGFWTLAIKFSLAMFIYSITAASTIVLLGYAFGC